MKFFGKLEDAKEAKQVIWIGYDPLEDASAKVMAHSIRSGQISSDMPNEIKPSAIHTLVIAMVLISL